MFEGIHKELEGPVWAPFEKPLAEATTAVLWSAGILLRDCRETFDASARVGRSGGAGRWREPRYRHASGPILPSRAQIATLMLKISGHLGNVS